MPLRKIADLKFKPCRHPEHEPPKHIVLDDGVWEHTCPGCGDKSQFIVNKPTWSVSH